MRLQLRSRCRRPRHLTRSRLRPLPPPALQQPSTLSLPPSTISVSPQTLQQQGLKRQDAVHTVVSCFAVSHAPLLGCKDHTTQSALCAGGPNAGATGTAAANAVANAFSSASVANNAGLTSIAESVSASATALVNALTILVTTGDRTRASSAVATATASASVRHLSPCAVQIPDCLHSILRILCVTIC